ncbi:hypothetical protein [Gordonia bronchialis]|uniref:hypothetical protein n=1 Tax=Gordonia bronchialis TaxID=2054 RepID=UPI00226EF21D|nr:hypothetical protein [Gordonia bronchialis]
MKEDADPDTKIGLEALQVVIDLHAGHLEQAIAAAEGIIAMEPAGDYLLHSITEALSKIGREIYRMRSNGTQIDTALATTLAAIESRLETLQRLRT